MDDPDHDKNLISHTGYHPETQLNFAKNLRKEEYEILATQVWSILHGESPKTLFLAVCKKERHRSVACRRLLFVYFRMIILPLERHLGKSIDVFMGREPVFGGEMCD